MPSKLKGKITYALVRLAAFKGKLFEKPKYQVLVDKLVAEGYLYTHTLARAAAGFIRHKVLGKSRSSLGPINPDNNKSPYQRHAEDYYHNGKPTTDIPTAVPQTVRDSGAPDRAKKTLRLPISLRGTKRLTDAQAGMKDKSATYSDDCNDTKSTGSSPLSTGMNSQERSII
jgi:hypothetical protein